MFDAVIAKQIFKATGVKAKKPKISSKVKFNKIGKFKNIGF